MNFQLILLDHRQKIFLTTELELFNLSFFASCPFDWVQRRLSHSSNYRWGSTVDWNITQHFKSDDCNIAQVLMYGCWSTSSELSGLSQADKVSLLQGVLKTQVKNVWMLSPWTFPTGRFLHRSYSWNSQGLTVQRVFFRFKSSNTQFVLKKILPQNQPQLQFQNFSSTLNWRNNKLVGILIKNRELFKNCKTGVFRRSASPGGSNTCIFSTEWNGYWQVKYTYSARAQSWERWGCYWQTVPPQWGGGRLFDGSTGIFYENCCNSGTESRKIDPKVGN